MAELGSKLLELSGCKRWTIGNRLFTQVDEETGKRRRYRIPNDIAAVFLRKKQFPSGKKIWREVRTEPKTPVKQDLDENPDYISPEALAVLDPPRREVSSASVAEQASSIETEVAEEDPIVVEASEDEASIEVSDASDEDEALVDDDEDFVEVDEDDENVVTV